MLTAKLIQNKFYLYSGTIVKIKKINKSVNKIYVEKLIDDSRVVIPFQQNELLLKRIYTVGEVAKIVERRPDTIRKYEKRGLIASAEKFGSEYGAYSSWRYYNEDDVYQMVEFFSSRNPGRPTNDADISIDNKIKTLNNKVKLTTRESYVSGK
jgi:hypothetical protein